MQSGENHWADPNQSALIAAVREVRAALEGHIAHAAPGLHTQPSDDSLPSALSGLCATFGLSRFERDILLLCAAMEIDAGFASLCGSAHGNPSLSYPTFNLAMAALPEPHWTALTPSAPLRRWRLIEVQTQTGVPLVLSPLRIDERILHYLAGAPSSDERLAGMVEPVGEMDLVPSHQALAERIRDRWTRGGSGQAGVPMPLIQLVGASDTERRAVAAAGCREVGLGLAALCAEHLPAQAAEIETFARLWERESVLGSSALLVEAEAGTHAAQVTRFLERLRAPALLSLREPWRALRRAVYTIQVCKPTASEQRQIWEQSLDGAALGVNGSLDRLVGQFNLSAPAIRESVSQAIGAGAEGDRLPAELWAAGRAQARPHLDDLAQRIESRATWDDLVLPLAEEATLQEITANVRRRAKVYVAWGFAGVSGRGLGISALFSGSSGTGKTLAAEVIANTLALDLYRIDLAGVVSKYIGETEKNLKRVFDAADEGGAILFFDEADALFGKRSEVKDSHDRYANIEINYLLQRMEQYRGLAVLATNMKSALDAAFLRRIRFVVNFPFPSVEQRAAIWSRIFPPQTPVEDLEIARLARLEIAGGNIRNIAVGAAFLAAENDGAVRMSHIWQAARAEFAKIEKPFSQPSEGRLESRPLPNPTYPAPGR